MIFSKEEMIFKQMTHNSDEPFPIVIDKLNCFPFNFVRKKLARMHEHLESC